MASVNKVILIGNLGQEPESKHSKAGSLYLKLRLATNENIKRGDIWEEKTEWHNILAFGKIATFIEPRIQKGTQLYVEGRIQTRSWDKQDGTKGYMTESLASQINIISGRVENTNGYTANNSTPNQNQKPTSETEDDLPF